VRLGLSDEGRTKMEDVSEKRVKVKGKVVSVL
jgi:hypothetical protein